MKQKNMVKIGTPMTTVGKKAILCGSGELGKEVAIELQRYGVDTCYYGHLHGDAIRGAFNGVKNGVSYRLISADALSFRPVRIL